MNHNKNIIDYIKIIFRTFKELSPISTLIKSELNLLKKSQEYLINLKSLKIRFWVRANKVDLREIIILSLFDEYGLKRISEDLKVINYGQLKVLDAGAFIGDSTVLLSKFFPKAKILALEPIKTNLTLLNKNIKINNCKNVTVVSGLLTGSVNKSNNLKTDVGFDSINLNPKGNLTKNKIKSFTLKELFKKYFSNLQQNDFVIVKLDIEGAEFEIIKEEIDFIENNIDIILMEFHGRDGLANTKQLLHKNFEIYLLNDHIVYARNKNK